MLLSAFCMTKAQNPGDLDLFAGAVNTDGTVNADFGMKSLVDKLNRIISPCTAATSI